MKVMTVDTSMLNTLSGALEAKIVAAGYTPDLIVGIASGGLNVARLMFTSTAHAAVVCRRRSTSVKGRHAWVWKTVRMLPVGMRNALRIMESKWLMNHPKSPSIPLISPGDSVAITNASAILLVDDAVDSGQTMAASVRAIRRLNPDAKIITAALTVTLPRPAITPDHSIYNNGYILRFPWSMDN